MNILLLVLGLYNSIAITVKSPSFTHNSAIPATFTCDGDNTSPALMLSGVPKEAKSLALIVDDPDAPSGTFVHWVMWNIPVADRINANSAPGDQGVNSKGENKYTGPCPPKGLHHYHFKVYALDTKLNLSGSTDKAELEKAMRDHILASGDLVGTYQRKR